MTSPSKVVLGWGGGLWVTLKEAVHFLFNREAGGFKGRVGAVRINCGAHNCLEIPVGIEGGALYKVYFENVEIGVS